MFLARHLVVAAAGRVGTHQLPVGRDDRGHQHDDRGRHPRRQVQVGRAADRQHEQDLLRRVGDARQRVAGEDRQRQAFGQQRVPGPIRAHRAADDQSLEDPRDDATRRRIRTRAGSIAQRAPVCVRITPALVASRTRESRAGRRRSPRLVDSGEEMCPVHIVIMGCGRVGSSLAHHLERLEQSVAVIDQDPGAFRRLGEHFAGPHRSPGVGFDRETLIAAGIEEADAFAAVSSGDNSNIIAARVARETFGVQKVDRPHLRPQARRGVRAARHPDGRHGAVDGQSAAQERCSARRPPRRGATRPVRSPCCRSPRTRAGSAARAVGVRGGHRLPRRAGHPVRRRASCRLGLDGDPGRRHACTS